MASVGHVIEEERDAMVGVEFLTSSRQEWSSSFLNGHITWHLALHYLGRCGHPSDGEVGALGRFW